MKKYQLISGLSCLAALTGCQNLAPELSNSEKKELAMLVNQDDVVCLVADGENFPGGPQLTGKFVSYQLQFDTNNNQKADTELAVCADVSHLSKEDIQAYVESVKSLSDTGVRSLKNWQQHVETNTILSNRKPETFMYRIQEECQHTK